MRTFIRKLIWIILLYTALIVVGCTETETVTPTAILSSSSTIIPSLTSPAENDPIIDEYNLAASVYDTMLFSAGTDNPMSFFVLKSDQNMFNTVVDGCNLGSSNGYEPFPVSSNKDLVYHNITIIDNIIDATYAYNGITNADDIQAGTVYMFPYKNENGECLMNPGLGIELKITSSDPDHYTGEWTITADALSMHGGKIILYRVVNNNYEQIGNPYKFNNAKPVTDGGTFNIESILGQGRRHIEFTVPVYGGSANNQFIFTIKYLMFDQTNGDQEVWLSREYPFSVNVPFYIPPEKTSTSAPGGTNNSNTQSEPECPPGTRLDSSGSCVDDGDV